MSRWQSRQQSCQDSRQQSCQESCLWYQALLVYTKDPLVGYNWICCWAPYAVPKGSVGRRFVDMVTSEFHGARTRKWNSERPLTFISVVLQRTSGVRRSCDIRRRLSR
jgi:hypothetical protein